MPQIRIAKFENAEEAEQKLKACMEFNETAKQKLSFSEFLAKTTFKDRMLGQKSDKDIVVADFSGLTINGAVAGSLEGLDFGHSIFTGTEFTQCNLQGAKLSSSVSMKGCRFLNGCNLSKANIEGDLTDVSIGDSTNISNLDLTNAISIEALNIDAKCVGSGIKIDFPSTTALKNFTQPRPVAVREVLGAAPNQTLQNTEALAVPATRQQAEFKSIASLVAGGANIAGQVLQVGGYFLYDFASHVAKVGAGAAHGILDAVQAPIVPVNTVAAREVLGRAADGARAAIPNAEQPSAAGEQPAAPTVRNAPLFVYSVKGQNLADTTSLTADDIKRWASETAETKVSLKAFAQTHGKSFDPTPIIQGVKLENIDFKGLDFSGAVIADSKMTNCSFSDKSNLAGLAITACTLENCRFTEVMAPNIDCSKSKFNGCEFTNCDMTRARFVESTLANTIIDHSKMEHAELQRAGIDGLSISNSYIDHSKFTNITGDKLTIKQSTATNLNLVSAHVSNAKFDVADMSNTVASDAKLPKAEVKNVTLNNFQAIGIQMPGAHLEGTNISGKSDLSHSDFSGSTLKHSHIRDSTMAKAQFSGAIITQSSIESTKAMGSNFSAAIITAGSKIENTDLSHGVFSGAQISESTITSSNLSGADLTTLPSGQKTRLSDVIIDNSNLADTKLNGAIIEGGAIKTSILTGSDLTNATLGTAVKPTSIASSVVMDQTTKLTGAKLGDPQAKPTILDLDGKKIEIMDTNKKRSSPTLQDIQTESDQNARINDALAPTKWVRAITNRAVDAFKSFGSGAESVGKSINERKPSRLGVALGVAAGVVIGAAIIAATAATMGAALPIVGAIVLGSCAIGGGVAGHVAANTSPGRRFFMTASTAAAAVALGPIGLLAAPVMFGYNLLSGKRNAFSNAIGSTIKTIGNLSKKAGASISGLTYSDQKIVHAYDVKERADSRQAKVVAAQQELEAKLPDSKEKARHQALHSIENPTPKQNTGFKLFDRGKKQNNKVGVVSTELAQNAALGREMDKTEAHRKQEAAVIARALPEQIADSRVVSRANSIDAPTGIVAVIKPVVAPPQQGSWGARLWNGAKAIIGLGAAPVVEAYAADPSRASTINSTSSSNDPFTSAYQGSMRESRQSTRSEAHYTDAPESQRSSISSSRSDSFTSAFSSVSSLDLDHTGRQSSRRASSRSIEAIIDAGPKDRDPKEVAKRQNSASQTPDPKV